MDNLSKEAKAKLVEWDYKYKEALDRMSWDNYFLAMAFFVARRSHDPQTQNGCIIVNTDNEIIVTGYNGYIRNVNDEVLPNIRPEKYPWMIHAEHNTVLNAAKRGIALDGATAYITGKPCMYCIQYMYQAGIKRVVHSNIQSSVSNLEHESAEQEILRELIKNKLIIEEKTLDIASISSNFGIVIKKMADHNE